MADPLAKVREHYLDVLVKAIPLHRALIFLLFTLFFVTDAWSNPYSALFAVFERRIYEIFSASDGLLWTARVADLAIAALLTTLVLILERLLKANCFDLFVRLAGKQQYLHRLGKLVREIAIQPEKVASTKVAQLEEKVSATARELRRREIVAEMLIAVSIYLMITIPQIKSIDLGILICCFVGCIGMQYSIFAFYTSKLFPRYVVLQSARGGMHEFGAGLVEGEADLYNLPSTRSD